MTPTELATLWEQILEKTKKTMHIQMWENWIQSSLIPLSYENNILTLGVMKEFLKMWIEKTALPLLEETASEIMNQPVQVIIVNVNGPNSISPPVDPVAEKIYLPQNTPRKTSSLIETPSTENRLPTNNTPSEYTLSKAVAPLLEHHVESIPHKKNSSSLNPRYTFDTFIVGNSNRFAYSAALAIAEAPAQNHNPFFLYGSSGLGKTHLMHAIGHYAEKFHPEMQILCITSEKFTNDLINSLRDKNPESFRQKYRNIDILLVDDIQFLQDKEHTQEEFFHTFNQLYEDKKQIILTSDRLPKDMKKLQERLRTRFEWGLTTNIQPPDIETRIAILRKKAELEHVEMPNDSVTYIASNVNSNIRQLEGALHKVLSYSSLSHQPITLDMTIDVLKDMVSVSKNRPVTTSTIQEIICAYFKIKIDDLLGKKKTKNIAYPRQIAMYLSRELTTNTLPHIGQVFGGRDHTTVIYAHDKILKEIEKDPQVRDLIATLTKKINNPGDN